MTVDALRSASGRRTLLFCRSIGANLALLGMSQGGYFSARAAAFEHRIRAAIFFDGVYDFSESITGVMPNACEEITYKSMQDDTNLRWEVTQGMWSFGCSSLVEFLMKAKQYTMEGIAGQIACPSLVLEAEGDMFFKNQPQRIYDALQCRKQLFRFTKENGAENHCQSGALSYLHEVVFNWLDETLKLHDDRSVYAVARS